MWLYYTGDNSHTRNGGNLLHARAVTRAIKKQFGKDLTLVGNLDVGAALSQGSPDDERAEVRALIDDVGRDAGFVPASSHSITANVAPENFLAMVDSAHTYGSY